MGSARGLLPVANRKRGSMGKLTPGALNGIRHTADVNVETPDGQSHEVEIRPLRHSEAKQVQRTLSGAVRYRSSASRLDDSEADVELDGGAFVEARYDAQLLAASLGTTDEAWTEETIDELWPSTWIAEVGQEVMEISGIGDPSDEGKDDDSE